MANPEAHQGGARAGGVEPGVQARGRGEQRRRARAGESGQTLLGLLDRALLVELRCNQPLVQAEGVAGGREDAAAVDDPQRVVHAQAQPFEHGGEVPRVDGLAVGGGLAADRFQPPAVQQRRPQGMGAQRLVEPGDRRGRLGERRDDRGVRGWRHRRQEINHPLQHLQVLRGAVAEVVEIQGGVVSG